MRTRIALALSALGLLTSGAAFAVINVPALSHLVSTQTSTQPQTGDLMDVVATTAPEVTLAPEPTASADDENDDAGDDSDDDSSATRSSSDDSEDDSSDDSGDDDESEDDSDSTEQDD